MLMFGDFIRLLPRLDKAADYQVYPDSLNQVDSSWVFMAKEDDDILIVTGDEADVFSGDEVIEQEVVYKRVPLTHENAVILRRLFPFTAPVPVLDQDRTVGVGDRLGIACPGHIRVFKEYDCYPVFAQQSIRELNLTNRTYEDVLDCVSFSVLRDGYKDGFGADGDHLKKTEEIEYALSLGFTMITLDCSDYIRNDVHTMSDETIRSLCDLSVYYRETYLSQKFCIEDDIILSFSEDELRRIILIYGDAIGYAVSIYNDYFADGKSDACFELSIDETATETSPLQHFFVANELKSHGVRVSTIAPRFCGEFQKGVDYIGDLAQFESELIVHAAIARYFGYKLSIHSGSDKFSTFALIGKYTKGRFHLKTAGTNWLEAMRCVAKTDPSLYRDVHKYALLMFGEAKRFYHVTTDLSKIPDIDLLTDQELPSLFQQNDARQLIHITYGFILNAKNADDEFLFKNRLYDLWKEQCETYSNMIYEHIEKHLSLLYNKN